MSLGGFQNILSERWEMVAREVSFWKAKWLGEENLSTKHNCAFLNSEQKFNSIAEMGAWRGEEWHWELLWRRPWFQ